MSEIIEKFRNLNIVKRDLSKKSTKVNSEDSQFYVRMYNLVLELRQEMVAGEEKEWHLKLIHSCRLTLGDDKSMETQRKDWWNVKDDG